MDDFVLWLKDERESRRMSAKFLSETIGKSHSYIHSLEKGLVKEIPEEVKENILKALGYKIEMINELNSKIKEESIKRERCITELMNHLQKLKTKELEGLVDIIRKRPDLLWTLGSLMEESDKTESIYENLFSFANFLKFINNKGSDPIYTNYAFNKLGKSNSQHQELSYLNDTDNLA